MAQQYVAQKSHPEWLRMIEAADRICPGRVADPPTYPCVGKNEVRRVLSESRELQALCAAILTTLQTPDELRGKVTIDKNGAGWDGADAARGCSIGEKVIAGEPLTAADRYWLLEEKKKGEGPRIERYATQLGRQLRLLAWMRDPIAAGYCMRFSEAPPPWVATTTPEEAGIVTRKERDGKAKKAAPTPDSISDEDIELYEACTTKEQAMKLREALLEKSTSTMDRARSKEAYFDWLEAHSG